MGTHQPIRKVVSPEIPDKLYFRIGDVARLCEVPAYVLRFWETEFPQLKPNKGGTGQRLYRKRDVEMALRIKSLLYDQGYTIPGARQVFKNDVRAREAAALPIPEHAPLTVTSVDPPPPALGRAEGVQPLPPVYDKAPLQNRQLGALRSDLRTLLAMLSKPVSAAHPPIEGKVKPMRPRLVLEPRPPNAPRLEPQRLDREQRDLFFGDGADPAE